MTHTTRPPALNRRQVALLGLGALASIPAWANDYPARPITIQIGVSAGGPTDRQFRVLSPLLTKQLGQAIVIDNRPGVGGTVAITSMIASSRPDGYTLALVQPALFRVPHIQNVTWDPIRDLTYVVGMSSHVLGIAVRTDSPFKNWSDVADEARKQPGRVTYATTGIGGTMHLSMVNIERAAKLQFNHIPYKGTADSVRALLAGESDLLVDAISVVMPQVQAGKARLLMTWEKERLPLLPAVPTATELGLPIVQQSPIGIVGPKGMPREIVDRLHTAFVKAMNEPEYVRLLDELYQTPWYQSADDYTAQAKAMLARERVLVQQAGLSNK